MATGSVARWLQWWLGLEQRDQWLREAFADIDSRLKQLEGAEPPAWAKAGDDPKRKREAVEAQFDPGLRDLEVKPAPTAAVHGVYDGCKDLDWQPDLRRQGGGSQGGYL